MQISLLPKVSIKKGREWPVAQGHPWLFSGAISQVPKAEPGALVDLVDTNGNFVARGYYNPLCDIAVRVLTRKSDEIIDSNFFKQRIAAAYTLRKQAIDMQLTNVYRLVNAEADFLPGFIVDYYAGVLVVQSHTAGGDKLLADFTQALAAVVDAQCIIVRNDAGVRKREGLERLPPYVVTGENPQTLIVKENGLKFAVDVLSGQKTGFYSDQRDKRAALQRYCLWLPETTTAIEAGSLSENLVCRSGPEGDIQAAQSTARTVPLHPPVCPEAPPYGRMQCAPTIDRGLFRQAPGASTVIMLNCFSYSGAFSVYASNVNHVLHTVNVDQSQRALEEARHNFQLNDISLAGHEFICADAFTWLEEAQIAERMFDIVVLDPPAFAKSHKDKPKALKAYKRLNMLGMKVTKPGGIMISCSCSGSISFDEFQASLKEAAAELKRSVQILETFQTSVDHPVNIAAPESGYLKVVFCRVLKSDS